jgi:hypothetical protein
MSAERKLKVSFDEPEHGWIAITMSADDEQFMLITSHVPYDPISELAVALNKILEGYSEATVRWTEEPAEVARLVLARSARIAGAVRSGRV